MRKAEAQLIDLGLVALLPTSDAANAFGLDDDTVPLAIQVGMPERVDDVAIPVIGQASTIMNKAAAAMGCA